MNGRQSAAVWACIAARNEAASIGMLVERLRRLTFEVVVVDDGSSDSTGALASEAGAQVIRHGRSEGIGPSLMDAWAHALSRGAERLVQLDAGGSHDPGDAVTLLGVPADVVVGSRFLPGSRYVGRPRRAQLSRLAAWGCGWRAQYWLSDWTSGYRAFTARAAEGLLCADYRSTMHAWQIEVVREALRRGYSVAEAPITYTAGESSFRWRTALDALRAWGSL